MAASVNVTVVPVRPEESSSLYVSDEVVRLLLLVEMVLFGVGISLFGVVANSLIVSVFRRQGFSDKTSISLCSLALADLGVSLFSSFGYGFSVLQLLGISDLDFEIVGVRSLLVEFPRHILAKISSWLTAYISTERCLCVIFPFWTRTSFTPRITITFVLCITFAVLILHYPIYYVRTFQWVFHPRLNRTLLTVVFRPDRVNIYRGLSAPLFSFLPLANLIVICLNAVVLGRQVMRSAKWRENHSSADSAQKRGVRRSRKEVSPPWATATSESSVTSPSLSAQPAPGYLDSDSHMHKRKTEEKNVGTTKQLDKPEVSTQSRKSAALTKMITVVTVVFIVCTTPYNISSFIGFLFPDFSITGRLRNLFLCIIIFLKLLESVNSVLNIFVYYKMSSKFRATFNEMYTVKKQLKQQSKKG